MRATRAVWANAARAAGVRSLAPHHVGQLLPNHHRAHLSVARPTGGNRQPHERPAAFQFQFHLPGDHSLPRRASKEVRDFAGIFG